VGVLVNTFSSFFSPPSRGKKIAMDVSLLVDRKFRISASKFYERSQDGLVLLLLQLRVSLKESVFQRRSCVLTFILPKLIQLVAILSTARHSYIDTLLL
jgi:hypothetical protein